VDALPTVASVGTYVDQHLQAKSERIRATHFLLCVGGTKANKSWKWGSVRAKIL
jgi:hypothetical protein